MINGWFMAAALLLAPSPAYAQTAGLDTVHVAAPTGETATDRANILAALDQVEPGGTVQFAPGTYLVGEIIHVTVPRITLVGHPLGTTLRGCHPTDFPESPEGLPELFVAVLKCNGLDMAGGYQRVLNLTFEYAWHALVLGGMECLEGRGCVPVLEPVATRRGGYLVQGNTFRNSGNGVRTIGEWTEPAVIRENRFVNTFHAAVVHGSTVHILDNDISVPEPEQVPGARHPGIALSLSATDLNVELALRCAGNVIAGNRIEGHPDGISIALFRPGTSCRENVIQDNTIRVARVRVPTSWALVTLTDADSSVVGVPLALVGSPEAFGDTRVSLEETGQEGRLEGNVIEGNHIQGAEGLGMELYRASGNRIVNNIIDGIRQRTPYPGLPVNSTDPERAGWREANGAGIWVSPGSDGNEIIGNTFKEIAASTVVIEGDSNHVELTDPGDAVRDLGTGNRVRVADGAGAMLDGDEQGQAMHQSRFVDAGGVRLHYLDFGGEGLPIIFVHSPAWDAHTWETFALRFADGNRVLAVTRRGYGRSEGHGDGYDVPTQAESLVAFLDALGIERAVFAGNSGPTAELTYLAEHHPERIAGLIYLAGLVPLWLDDIRRSDPSGAGEMAFRAIYSEPADRDRLRLLWAYRPEFLNGDRPPIAVPALAFVARSGTRGSERWVSALSLVGSPLLGELYREMPPSPWRDHLERLVADEAYRLRELERIEDPAARAYLLRLAGDEALQAAVHRHHQEVIRPALVAGQEQFRQAFGDDLRLVRLDGPEVEGYEYRDAPDLIEAHVRRFLEEVSQTAQERDEPTPSEASGSGVSTSRGSDGTHAAPAGGQAPPGDRAGAQLPLAHPNDYRTPAGQFVDGELRVELEAVEAEWYPRGPDGPRIVTAAFAEPGGPPQVPGPLIRASAGIPVHVRVRNRLGRSVTVRGLLDRAALGAPERPEDADPAEADFFFADSLVVPAGETREVRFTPTAEVSSFYYGRRAPEEGGFANPTPLPGNFGDEGVFLGGLVVDPADVSHPPDERVFMITRWAGRSEPSTLAVTFKFMINGLSWPFTERLEHEVGDTVRWRLINASAITHPMHLHGFYFTVDGRGDTDADTVYTAGERRAVVTDVMPHFSSLRLTWVPERPGNWLFHCHLIRHMGALQRFAEEGGPGGEGMGGLVMGLVVRPRPGAVEEEPAPERTIHLWTSRTPDVFDGLPELSFVAREEPGSPPLDTAVVPGTPLVLERGQPTDIVVHNRLDIPISVHWHGLEVRSLYDGVGNWSGPPGATRPPIAPGDSARVHIAPPRAGTFIYHVHGETGHELSQGLYGPFLVLPEGEMRHPERDRVYVLAARGARRDPPPVVNGHPSPPPERFAPGGTYRLRFIHISPDARKRVRLLKDGEPVRWRPLAKDGADLPDAARVPEPAAANLGVGETFDAEWAPAGPGAYTLEVVTTHYSASGLPPTLQRIAFGVGEVSDQALVAAAHVEPPAPPPPSPLDTMPAIDLDERELRPFVGTYTAPGVPVEFTVGWQDGGLRMSVTGRQPRPLVPLSPTVFRWEDERTERVEFEREDGRTVMLLFGMRLLSHTSGIRHYEGNEPFSNARYDDVARAASDTVQVTPPTGDRETDRASILAALERVRPGGTVQFAPGTYLVGAIIRVTVPRVTLLGHPDGTTLRGCDPADLVDLTFIRDNCNGLELAGGHQTVRGFTFENASWALHLGCCQSERIEYRSPDGSVFEGPAIHPTTGGHLVEGNTFRSSRTGVRVNGAWSEPAVVRNNRFIDNWHSVSINGNTVHLLDNDISAPEPDRVPGAGFPWDAVKIGPPLPIQGADETLTRTCAHNVVAGNRIEGLPDGIRIDVTGFGPGTSCRNNVIRDNTIMVRRVTPPAESVEALGLTEATFIMLPLALRNPRGEGIVEDNLIEGNRIIGAEGLGIEILHASKNRIVENTISAIRRRDPFPGDTPTGHPPEWRDANGSGIWLSPGSDENEIRGNTFEDLASHAVVLEGDRNRVVTRSASDAVRDLGTGNRWTSAEPDQWTDPSPHQVRFVTIAPDVRLEVLDWGGAGQPLVLLAGMMATAHTFDDFAPGLTDRFRVLAVTRRGFGASSQPEAGYGLDTLVADIRIVLDSLGIERAALLGHSFGAAEIVRFAALWPERVSHLVNVDGLMPVDPEGLAEAMGAAPTWPPPGDAERASVPVFADYIARIYGVRLPEAELRARWRVLPDGRIGEEVTPGRIMGAFAQANAPTPLDDVRAPLLAFRAVSTSAAALIPYYGELDAEDRERADRAFPALQRVWSDGWAPYAEMEGARIVDFQDANHHLYISHEREVIEAVREFLLAPMPRGPGNLPGRVSARGTRVRN